MADFGEVSKFCESRDGRKVGGDVFPLERES